MAILWNNGMRSAMSLAGVWSRMPWAPVWGQRPVVWRSGLQPVCCRCSLQCVFYCVECCDVICVVLFRCLDIAVVEADVDVAVVVAVVEVLSGVPPLCICSAGGCIPFLQHFPLFLQYHKSDPVLWDLFLICWCARKFSPQKVSLVSPILLWVNFENVITKPIVSIILTNDFITHLLCIRWWKTCRDLSYSL